MVAVTERVGKIRPSATLALAARAKEMRAEGKDVISFSVGEPDFEPPDHILDAAREGIAQGCSKYTPAAGLPALRAAAARWLTRRYDLDYAPDEIIVSNGAKHSLANAFAAVVEPGTEVVIPAPYWLSYPPMVELMGGTPVVLSTDASTDYKVTPDQLAAALSPRTSAVLLNSPSNPTGAVYTRAELEALVGVLRDHDVWIVSDDIYGELVYDGVGFTNVLHVAPELRSRTIVVNGVSKAFAMTGWRVGILAAPTAIARAIAGLQSHTTSNPAAVSQHAAIAAFEGSMAFLDEWRAAFDERRRRMVAKLRAIPGVVCPMPQGAFYVFPDVSAYVGRRASDGPVSDTLALSELLLNEAHVAVVPGEAFGAPGCLRLSYACELDAIERGLDRMADALLRLEP